MIYLTFKIAPGLGPSLKYTGQSRQFTNTVGVPVVVQCDAVSLAYWDTGPIPGPVQWVKDLTL